MALRWWWLGLAWLIAALAWCVWWWRHRTVAATDAAPVAHTALLRRSPRYAALVRQASLRAAAELLALTLVVAGAGILAARWAGLQVGTSATSNRDIMLCLDASSSMTDYDGQVVAAYSTITEKLKGERIGLTVWSGAAISIFPLTDDYGYVKSELNRAAEAFRTRDYDYIAGINPPGRRSSSQIGDGLVSCLQQFDQPKTKRTRIVLLASDNDIQGEPIYPLDQAAAIAAKAGVVVHGIAPTTADPADVAALRTATAQTHGTVVMLDDSDGPSAVVDRIDALATSGPKIAPVITLVDRPAIGTVVAGLGVLVLLLLGAVPWPARPSRRGVPG